jgi:hypothetical protein
MTSNPSVGSIPPSRRRKKQDLLRTRPKEKSRLDGYQTAKGGGLSDKADDDKKTNIN